MTGFNEIVDRHNTYATKWDKIKERFDISHDVYPMWIADMEFKTANEIIKSITRRAKHGIFGYTYLPKEYYLTLINWNKRRYNWNIKEEWISFVPSVLASLSICVDIFSKEKDGILVQTPVYHRFFDIIREKNRNIDINKLLLSEGRYKIDFADLEDRLAKEENKIMFLCNPQNPAGRVWQPDELRKVGELCIKHNVILIADEIHCDITKPSLRYTPIASLSDDIANNTIVLSAPTKTFNLAGLQTSQAIIKNKGFKKEFDFKLQENHLGTPNIFAIEATITAYTECDTWLDTMRDYIWGNYTFLKTYIEENIADFSIIELEGTYLALIDYSKTNLASEEFYRLMLTKAKVAVQDGKDFGDECRYMFRLNLGCERSELARALKAMKDVFRKT